ncbi:calcineurin-like phosphoesterase C-terminal domain-containing protein, partial [Bacteroides ovatus]|nr:calcineurin-like phosphoesterase C-terminal domain-containing protein [Bacteroides ovatus]
MCTWWKADICLDGTPRGCGIYEVNDNDVKWYYKSSGISQRT